MNDHTSIKVTIESEKRDTPQVIVVIGAGQIGKPSHGAYVSVSIAM